MIKQIQLLAGTLFLAILVYSGLWYTAAFQAEKDVTALLADWRNSGISVEHGTIEHGGFPYRITVGIKDLTVTTRERGLNINAKNIQLISHLWTPQHWLAETYGLQVSAAANSTRLTSDFMLASYKVHDDGKTLVAFDSNASKGFFLSRLAGKAINTPDTWQLFLRFGDTEGKASTGLYSERKLGFKLTAGGNAYTIDLMGGISGPVVSDWTKEQLTNWSNEGGLVEIDRLTMVAGGGTIKGNGSLTLDENFQPLGSASLSVTEGDKVNRRLLEGGFQLESTIPNQGLLSLMLQNGSLSGNGTPLLSLENVID